MVGFGSFQLNYSPKTRQRRAIWGLNEHGGGADIIILSAISRRQLPQFRAESVPMQNRMASPMDDAQMAQYAAQQSGIAWTPEQMVRLEHEWRQLQRNFAYHPCVRIVPIQGNPPAEYQIEFKTRTVYIREDGQLDYITAP